MHLIAERKNLSIYQNHEDVIVHLHFFDQGCQDLFAHSFDPDSDSPTIDIYKLLVFDDPYSDEVETPQNVEAL